MTQVEVDFRDALRERAGLMIKKNRTHAAYPMAVDGRMPKPEHAKPVCYRFYPGTKPAVLLDQKTYNIDYVDCAMCRRALQRHPQLFVIMALARQPKLPKIDEGELGGEG